MEEKRENQSNGAVIKRIIRELLNVAGGLLILAAMFGLGSVMIEDFRAIESLTRGGASTLGLNALWFVLLYLMFIAVLWGKKLKKIKERGEDGLWNFLSGAAVVMMLLVLWGVARYWHWDFRLIVNGSQVIVASLFANEIGWRGHLAKLLSAVNISFNLLLVTLIVTWAAYSFRTGLWRKWFARQNAETSRAIGK